MRLRAPGSRLKCDRHAKASREYLTRIHVLKGAANLSFGRVEGTHAVEEFAATAFECSQDSKPSGCAITVADSIVALLPACTSRCPFAHHVQTGLRSVNLQTLFCRTAVV